MEKKLSLGIKIIGGLDFLIAFFIIHNAILTLMDEKYLLEKIVSELFILCFAFGFIYLGFLTLNLKPIARIVHLLIGGLSVFFAWQQIYVVNKYARMEGKDVGLVGEVMLPMFYLLYATLIIFYLTRPKVKRLFS